MNPFRFRSPSKTFDSTALLGAVYHRHERALDVTFDGGNTYRYTGVAPGLYRDFLWAESKGRFVNSEIKPKFTCFKLVKQVA